MNETIIRRAFEAKRQEMKAAVKDVYAEIAETVKEKPMERVTKEITIAEASKLNACIQSLEQALRKEVCENMAAAGVPGNEVNILWARARRKVGAARIQLCREEGQGLPNQGARNARQERQEEKKSGKDGAGVKGPGTVMLASGAVVEIIGWMFIPGMGKAAAVVKGAGLVLMAAGVYMTYEESREKPRIKVTGEYAQQESGGTGRIIDRICEKQCQLNTSILCTWLDEVCEAVLQECGSENQ